MYVHALRTLAYTPRSLGLWWFTRRIRRVQRKKGNRAADAFFINHIGIHPSELFNDSYYADVVNYNLGMLMAHSGRAEEASELLSKTGLLPGPGGNMLFSDHQKESLALYEKQQAAAKRGMASIIITSLPKSGSASLTQSLSELMGSPIMRLSTGRMPNYALIQSWANRFSSGGLLTHDHFSATPHNLSVLQKAGISRIVVQVRDPRASTLSHINMKKSQGEKGFKKSKLTSAFKTIFPAHVEWLRSWVEAAHDTPWLTIHWVAFQDFKQQPWETLGGIVEPYADSWPMREIADKIAKKEGALVTANFHQGNDNAWRKNASPRLQKKMWKAIPNDVITFMGLQP